MLKIELSSAKLAYSGQVILDHISCSVEPGTLTTLVGPNGSGKSSLLRLIAGIAPVDSGIVAIGGASVESYSAKDLAKLRAFLPQHPITPEAMTVSQLVECGRFAYQGLFGSKSQDDREAVDWAMQECRVAQFRDKTISTLSGGERQRVWLASALAQKAQLILLDEPCSYLDIKFQLETMQLLHDIVDEQGLTILLSTHDINHCAQYSDNTLAISAGQIIADGPTRAVLNASLIKETFSVESEFFQSLKSEKRFCAFHTMPRNST